MCCISLSTSGFVGAKSSKQKPTGKENGVEAKHRPGFVRNSFL